MNYSLVAFLDVLGFSAMVERDSNSSEPVHLPIFVEIFKEVATEAREDVSLRMFSDSILIEAALTPENAARVFEVVIDLQQRFLSHHILLRGGIAFGKHFVDEYVTFSQALIAAYQVESQIARFPRVVVADDVLNYAWHHNDATPELHERLRALLAIDKDRATFVDYLNGESTKNFRSHVERCISFGGSPRETVLEKMRWLLDYYNYKAGQSRMEHIESTQFTNGFRSLEEVP